MLNVVCNLKLVTNRVKVYCRLSAKESKMAVHIPSDCILMLSGVPCVGKTTTAYNILKLAPEFRRVSELDIIRTVIRSVFRTLEDGDYLNKEVVQEHYAALFNSLSEKDLPEAKQQSKLLIPFIKEIVDRQQKRKIPTIIEGSSIVPSTYFLNNKPIEGFEHNVIFINLYLSDENEHVQRRIHRCIERENTNRISSVQDKVSRIRKSKNYSLHHETLELSKGTNRVYSIDTADMNQDAVVDKILQIINSLSC